MLRLNCVRFVPIPAGPDREGRTLPHQGVHGRQIDKPRCRGHISGKRFLVIGNVGDYGLLCVTQHVCWLHSSGLVDDVGIWRHCASVFFVDETN